MASPRLPKRKTPGPRSRGFYLSKVARCNQTGSNPRVRVRLWSAKIPSGLTGVLDSIIAAQHVLEMFRRTLPDDHARKRLDRLSNRLTKILAEARKLATL